MSWKKQNRPTRSIQLDKYHTWQYRKYPNLLLAGKCRDRKAQEFLWDNS